MDEMLKKSIVRFVSCLVLVVAAAGVVGGGSAAGDDGAGDRGSGVNWNDGATGGGAVDWGNTPHAGGGIDWSDATGGGAPAGGPSGEPAGGPSGGNGGVGADGALEAARRFLQSRYPLPRSNGFPVGLRGQARAFSIGRPGDNVSAAVYVPTYYDANRAWPVLIEGTQRGKLPQVVREMTWQAERQGFIFVAVEYLYFEGRVDRHVDVWTREGPSTVRVTSRLLDEMLADMVTDERQVLELLKTLKSHYTVDDRAVGVTGFLGASLMSYRLPLAYPGLFCTGISRSGDFHTDFLPSRMGGNARMVPITIIYGEKEADITLASSERAAEFFRRRDFRNLIIERIPNSGVDSRPEIAANSFRSAVEKAVGVEAATFYRLASQAGLVLGGDWPASATGTSARVSATASRPSRSRIRPTGQGVVPRPWWRWADAAHWILYTSVENTS